MKKTNNQKPIPSALRETWDWKQAVYEETKAMNTADALNHMHAGAAAIREAYGLRVATPASALGMVAEESPEYDTEKME